MMADTVPKQQYRDAMARLGAAVSVVTTAGPDGRTGFTASAVCSVTDDPPTLLVCMNRASAKHGTFERNGVLCVNVLAARQKALSPLFAGPPGEGADARFAAATWHELQTGSPVLEDAVVSFDCRIVQTTSVGTHSVFFCEVAAIRSGPAHEGLIYFGRDYHGLAKLP